MEIIGRMKERDDGKDIIQQRKIEKKSCFMNNFEENNRGKPILTLSIIIIIVSLQFFYH